MCSTVSPLRWRWGAEMSADEEIIEAYFEAFRNVDPDGIRRLIAPGAIIWHNFDQVDRDIASSLDQLAGLAAVLSDMHVEIVERFPLDDGMGVRLVLKGNRRVDGEPVASHQAKFFRIEAGRITRIEEYVAPPPDAC
jgi:ketosteroid isomerase-like protein